MENQTSIIYAGPSLIDGAPIVAIAIRSKRNRKTGPMVQTYIIRSDLSPMLASKTGADKAICGNCPHRGTPTTDPERKLAVGRTCYVALYQGPTIVWKTFAAGKYPKATNLDDVAAIGEGQMVRIGTYGDGAAVPAKVWDALISKAIGHTAYTHNGGKPSLYMKSVETIAQAKRQWRAGNRTFRTISDVAEIDKEHEILCPASKQAGARVQCAKCKLCAGNKLQAKSIAIPLH